MTMLAEITTCVIGVDPDKARIQVAAIDSATNGELGTESFPNTPDGHDAAMAWADAYADAGSRAWAIEGSGSYGSPLARSLRAVGEWAIDFSFPTQPPAPDGAKSDHLDAVRAGRETLGRTKLVSPRASGDGAQGAIRALMAARRSMVGSRTCHINALKAAVMCAPEEIISELEGLSTAALIKRCAGFRPASNAGPCDEIAATKRALRSQARAIRALETEIAELTDAIAAHAEHVAPELLDENGIGPVTAGQLLVSWGYQGRIHTEAAWARLAGVAPITATSGQNQTRHRLSRSGDRALNCAIHTIALCRARNDPATCAYIDKKTAEGKTTREARRCLKRHIARRLYRILENLDTTP